MIVIGLILNHFISISQKKAGLERQKQIEIEIEIERREKEEAAKN